MAAAPRRRNRGEDEDDEKDPTPVPWPIKYLVIVTSGVWVANFVLSVALDGYKASEAINAMFGVVVAGLFALWGHKDER